MRKGAYRTWLVANQALKAVYTAIFMYVLSATNVRHNSYAFPASGVVSTLAAISILPRLHAHANT